MTSLASPWPSRATRWSWGRNRKAALPASTVIRWIKSAESAGAAYVFVRSGGLWSQQAYLKASNTGV